MTCKSSAPGKGRFTRTVLCAALAAVIALPGVARAQDYPYPMSDILTELGMPEARFVDWWSKAPEKMRSKLVGAPLDRWGSIIICDYLGFRIGTSEGEACVKDRYEERMAAADQWGENGEYLGPSDECVARNKTDKWGRLICD